MKILLNKCFGGFYLSEEAYILYAKKKGLNIYKYKSDIEGHYPNTKSIYKYADDNSLFTQYFIKDFGTNIEISNEDCEKYSLYLREEERLNPILIEVVEELKEKASGIFGEINLFEIPDNSYYTIDNYDGLETLYYSNSKIEEI